MPTIGIVEDDQAISQMYRIKFEIEGYKVETAENGILGLEMIEKVRPDIILTDLMMPDMNGDEMMVKLRKTPFGKDLKIIVLTNIGEQEMPEVLKTLGILDIIIKASMTPRQVFELVKKHLAI